MKYAAYSKRMSKAVDYIEKNLKSNITYAMAAGAAGMSKDNFWRVFKKLFNETITSYIRGRKLTLIARRLTATKKPFMDICAEFGCYSPEIIIRAFKRKFLVSPAVYRKQGSNMEFLETPRLTEKAIRHILKGGVEIKHKKIKQKKFYIYGINRTVIMKNAVIDALKLFAKLLLSRQRNQLFGEEKIFAAAFPLEAKELKMLHGGSRVEVFIGAADKKIKGFAKKEIPGGYYSVFVHRGNVDMLPVTYNYMLKTLFKTYKKEVSPGFLYKKTENKLNMGDDLEMEIFLPV